MDFNHDGVGSHGETITEEESKRHVQIRMREKNRGRFVVGRSPRADIGAVLLPKGSIGFNDGFCVLELMNHRDVRTRIVNVVRQSEEHPCTTDNVLAFFKGPLVFSSIDLVGKGVVSIVFNHDRPFIGQLGATMSPKGGLTTKKESERKVNV